MSGEGGNSIEQLATQDAGKNTTPRISTEAKKVESKDPIRTDSDEAHLSQIEQTTEPLVNKPPTLEQLMADSNIRHSLKLAGIEDPQNMKILNIETGEEKNMTIEEIMDEVHKYNPNNFDLNKPPVDNSDQMLDWLRWKNAGVLTYSDNITPEMMQKALNVVTQSGLPIEKLSEYQIISSQNLTNQEIQQMKDEIQNPPPDFRDTISKTPGILNEEELKNIGIKAHEFLWPKRKEDPAYMPIALMENREQLPSEIGKHFDAHGMAKGNELRFLNYLLSHGVNPDRPFHTMQLKSDGGGGSAMGAANPYDTGAFIVLGHPDKLIRDGGINTVLVNEHYYDAVPLLTQKFPAINFVKADQMKDALAAILQKNRS